jgi:DnaJ family protein C protein 11
MNEEVDGDDFPKVSLGEEETADDSEHITDDNELSLDYYGVLNVSRNASDDEIRSAYKRLSMIFHPDKHRDPTDKQRAEQKFTLIHRAYETLLDSHKRTIYDLYGEKGLDSMKDWHVGQRLKTSEEIRAEYERHRLRIRQTELERLSKSVSVWS